MASGGASPVSPPPVVVSRERRGGTPPVEIKEGRAEGETERQKEIRKRVVEMAEGREGRKWG